MDQDSLDQVCNELLARRESLASVQVEMANLRSDGYSIVESMYIVSKVYGISLAEAKRIALDSESDSLVQDIKGFHEDAEREF